MEAILKLPLPAGKIMRERYIGYVFTVIELLDLETKQIIDRYNNLLILSHSEYQLRRLLRTINAGGNLPCQPMSVN